MLLNDDGEIINRLSLDDDVFGAETNDINIQFQRRVEDDR